MRRILLLLVFLGVGYYGWLKWYRPTPEINEVFTPRELSRLEAAAQDPFIKSRVGRMYTEWKERALATQKIQQRARRDDLAVLLTEIRRRLGDAGIHRPESVAQVLRINLIKAGAAAEETHYVVRKLLREAERDGTMNSHHLAD